MLIVCYDFKSVLGLKFRNVIKKKRGGNFKHALLTIWRSSFGENKKGKTNIKQNVTTKSVPAGILPVAPSFEKSQNIIMLYIIVFLKNKFVVRDRPP